MWPLHGERLGTQYSNNFANLLDQFLVSRPLLERGAPLRVDPESARIEAFPEMKGRGDYPAPLRAPEQRLRSHRLQRSLSDRAHAPRKLSGASRHKKVNPREVLSSTAYWTAAVPNSASGRTREIQGT
jgi:hypothetical protein